MSLALMLALRTDFIKHQALRRRAIAAIKPEAMAARAYVEGSGTVTGLKVRKLGVLAPVLHEVRKVPDELNLLIVLLPLFAA